MGIDIVSASMDEALDAVDNSIQKSGSMHIGVVNAAKIVRMQSDPDLRDNVLASDIIFADGMAVVWASKILGVPLACRITGIDLMYGIFSRGDTNGYRIYCLGATDEVVREVKNVVSQVYPGVRLVGVRNGYFTHDDEQMVAQEIKNAKPDVLFVAISSPKKEKFLRRWQAFMEVPVCHGVGGSFDVMAGKVRRAPKLWQDLGIEWLFRTIQEPRRLWRRYLITNYRFIKLVVQYRLGAKPS